MSKPVKKTSKTKLPNVDILYEDPDILAINKPAGLMAHSDGRTKGPFLADWVAENFPKAINVGEPSRALDGTPILRPGIVHRLDRGTSGVMLIAKTKKGYACLKKQFQDRTIKKKYIAFIWGDLKEEFGTIKKPIGRSKTDFRKWSADRGARGDLREAETYWTKIASLEEAREDGGKQRFTVIEAQPKTGRTHQIRVHFAAIQHAVVGDDLYAPNVTMSLGFKRPALHSRSVEFENCKGKAVTVIAPLPADFKKAGKGLIK